MKIIFFLCRHETFSNISLLSFHLGYSLAQEAEPFCSKQLALGWAPVHYQAIRNSDGIFNSNSLNGKSDSLSTINFDGNWNADNNWDNLTTQSLEPAVYSYIAATSTHFFITYAYFHARDWTRCNFFHLAQHENDLEGVLFVVERDGSEFGKLVIGYSIFHLNIERYVYHQNDGHQIIKQP